MEKLLPDICRIQYGFAFDSAKFSDSVGTPLIRIRDVVRGYSETYTTEQCGDEYVVQDGDMLIGMDGEFNIAHWKGGKAYLNQRVCRLIPTDKINSLYLFYFMPQALKAIEDKTPFVTVKHLSAKELNKVSVPIPSMAEQEKIATSLQKVDELISLRKQQLQKLDELVKVRFVEMFGTCQHIASMSELCSIITDGTHQPPKFQDNGIPFIFVSNLINNTVTYNAERFISEETYSELYKRTPIEIGDLLLSTVGSYGHAAVVVEDKKFLFQRHIAYLKPKHEIVNSFYLHAALLSPDGQRQIEEKVKGIAQKTLNLSEIKKILIPLPSIEDQKAFEAFAKQTNKAKTTVQKALDEAQSLFDSLMQKYFG